MRGYGAPEVERNYALARALAQKIGTTAEHFPVLYGLFRYNLLRARYHDAGTLSAELLEIARASNKPCYQVAAHRAVGSRLVYQGRHASAIEKLERVLEIEPTPELREESIQFDVVDPWVASRSYLAWSLWLTGQPTRAAEASERAIDWATHIAHPFSQALALSFAQWLGQFAGEVEGTRRLVDRSLAIARENQFEFWMGWGRVMRGWTMAMEGESGAVREIRSGIDQWRTQGSELGLNYFYVLLAEALGRAGRHAEGLNALAEARQHTESTGAAFFVPEMLRLEAELHVGLDPSRRDEALERFDASAARARAQGARALELRTLKSRAQLIRADDDPAHDAVRSRLRTLVMSFDAHDRTADLEAARALVEATG